MTSEAKRTAETLDLLALRPNNWFINREKLDRVREAWRRGEQQHLPPVLVTEIDGELSLIDGHSRAFAAFENGATQIEALVQELAQIEGSGALYAHIHREGPEQGIRSIADLDGRVVDAETHKRLWVGYCTAWLKENA